MTNKSFKSFLLIILVTFFAPLSQAMTIKIEKVKLFGPSDIEDQYHLNVTLNQMTETEFLNLKILLHSPLAEKFTKNKSYSLSSFLPIFAQKVLGKKIKANVFSGTKEILTIFEKLESPLTESEEIEVSSNCHSISWQWINFLQGQGSDEAFFFGVPGVELALELENFKFVPENKAKPGDVLLVSGPGGIGDVNGIKHSAVYLGNNLVLEKTDWGSTYYYRIALLSDVIKKYKAVMKNARFNFYKIDNSYIFPRFENLKSFKTVALEMSAKQQADYSFTFLKTAYEQTPAKMSSSYLLVSDYAYEKFFFSLYPILNTKTAAYLLVQ